MTRPDPNPKPQADAQAAPRAVRNESGIEIAPLYTPAELEASGGLALLGDPGAYPFTRGIHPLMYRKQPFTMRQYTGFGNAADTNRRFKFLIDNGQTGLNVAFDLPTQCGIDSDDVQAEGEVGRVGMAVDTLRDFEVAFDGIDLDRITVSLTINGAAACLIAMYLAMAEKRGFDVRRLRGTAQNDILKEYIVRRNGGMLPVTDITPARPGDTIENVLVRFRTVGDISCTAPVESDADTVAKIIAETATTTITERGATRLDDQTSDASMEQRKKEGYF